MARGVVVQLDDRLPVDQDTLAGSLRQALERAEEPPAVAQVDVEYPPQAVKLPRVVGDLKERSGCWGPALPKRVRRYLHAVAHAFVVDALQVAHRPGIGVFTRLFALSSSMRRGLGAVKCAFSSGSGLVPGSRGGSRVEVACGGLRVRR